MRLLALVSSALICALFFGCAKNTILEEEEDAGAPDAARVDSSACPGTQTRCGSTCTDTAKDANNCGACGTKCKTGQLCGAGKCTDTCAAPLMICGQFCIDPETDTQNCGGCSKACKLDQECKDKQCIKKCAPGFTVCDMDCVDTTTDANHCGDCSTVCGMNEVCTGSTCCRSGLVTCNGLCTDTQGDPNNCGSCGLACGGNTPYCTNGKCGVLSHGTKQLSFDYTSSGGCGDYSDWRTQSFGMKTFEQCEALANEYGAQFVGAPTLYGYNAPYKNNVRWVGEASASNGYVSTNGWNVVSSVSKNSSYECVLGYANGNTHGNVQFNQTMVSSNGKTYYVKDFGVISEKVCYTNAKDAGARPLNPQMFGQNLGVTHMIENHSCHGSVMYNGNGTTTDGGSLHNYRCFLGYN